jgi:type IV pilus assembly protein PilM
LLFTKPKRAIGLDIGTHSVKAVQMCRAGGQHQVEETGYALLDRSMLNSDPIGAHANAIREALLPMGVRQSLLVGALPGQTVVIRYARLPETSRDQMGAAVAREAGQNIPFDLSEVYLDWTQLDVDPSQQKPLKVLMVAAKHEVVSSRLELLEASEVQCGVLGVDSLALSDAAESCGLLRDGETVALVNIGLTSSSIHFIKNRVSNFIRDVSWGSREMIQEIAKARGCQYDEADKILRDADLNPPETVEEADFGLEDMPTQASQEKEDPFGEASGSLLDPLPGEEDVFGQPAAAPPPNRVSTDFGAPERDIRDILSGPLGRMVTEIRRSFDFYEQQLYEASVDRIVLSGGGALLKVVCQTFAKEFSTKTVEVAQPEASALGLGPHAATADLRTQPAQFMVAIGLAARGMAEL